jgi:predicted DCC family thiol-disulfide oxidoreductase YuxK
VPEGLLVYDGDCGFCVRSLGWLRRLGGRCAAAPWQALDLAALDLTVEDVTEAAWYVEGERRWRGHEAVGRALESSTHRWARQLGRAVRSRALRPLAASAYSWVARHRGRLPGGAAACARIDP